MQANDPLLSVNDPAGTMENDFGKTERACLRSVEFIDNCHVSIAPVLCSNFFHSSFRMSFDAAVDSLPISNAVNQLRFLVHREEAEHGHECVSVPVLRFWHKLV